MKKSILFVVFALFFLQMYAQTSVYGIAKSFENKKIELIVNKDYVTHTDSIIAIDTIDGLGNFNLPYNVKDITFAKLKIDRIQTILFLTPDNSINIKIPHFDSISHLIKQFAYNKPSNIPADFLPENANTLNHLIADFNIKYNDFIFNNIKQIIRQRDIALLDSFRTEIKNYFGNKLVGFFDIYVEYKLASIEAVGWLKGREALAESYILNRPVLYNHSEYMNILNQVYISYFEMVALKTYCEPCVLEAINNDSSYHKLFGCFGQDPLLADTTIREFVITKGLQEVFYSSKYNKNHIIFILKNIAKQPFNKNNAKIANNIITILTKGLQGQPAPKFELFDLDSNLVKLEDLKGKPIYLNFWMTKNKYALRDMLAIKKLYNIYKKDIHFVSICADDDYRNIKKIVSEQGFEWTQLHYANNPWILNEFNIRVYPSYYVLDKNGKFIYSPAISPSISKDETVYGNIDKMLLKVIQQSKN